MEITSDKAVIVFFLLWRQRLGDFSGSFEKKTVTAFFNYHKVTQNFGAALIWAGGGGGGLVSSAELINLISHPKKI